MDRDLISMTFLRLILVISLTAAGSGAAFAGFDEGVRAYESKNFKLALREFRAAAENDHAKAQYYLGRMYLMWEGVSADYKQAASFFERAAAQGNPNAQFYLGALHYLGEGVPRDYSKAVKWYSAAAAQGDPVAQYSLGVMYASGQGVTKDRVRALAWFNFAAAGGSKTAGKFADILTRKMTPAEIARAKQLTLEQISTRPKRKPDQ